MITVVESRKPPRKRNCSGQSILEFLIVLPLMVGLVMLMVRVNTAIQISIVNQQYTRAQALFIAYNSAVYPRLEQRIAGGDKSAFNQMIMGMSFKAISAGDDFTEGNRQPDAPLGIISRKGGSDDPKIEPEQRAKVRIRTTVTLCTQTNFVRDRGGAMVPVLDVSSKNGQFASNGNYKLSEGMTFDYCSAPEGRYSNE